MRAAVLHTRWLPVLLAVVVADLNFWYFASTGESHADYVGMAFFALLGAYYFWSLVRRPAVASLVCGLGALAGFGMMALREKGTWNPGYIPPYAVFIVFVLLGRAFDRSPARTP
jgi:hypothetical protein